MTSISDKILLLIVLFTMIRVDIWSQGEDQFLPTEIKQSTVVTEPESLNKGFFRLGTTISYVASDKLFSQDGEKEFITESVWIKDWTYSLLAQYGVTDRLQVEVDIPFKQSAYYYSWEFVALTLGQVSEDAWNLKGNGISDIDLNIRYLLLTEKSMRPSLVGDLIVTFPTGRKNPSEVQDVFDYKLPVGFGEFNLKLRFQARKIIYPVSYKIYASYSHGFGGTKIFNPIDPQELKFQSGDRIRTGVRIEMLLNDWIALSNDIEYLFFGKDDLENALPSELYSRWALSYQGGFVFQIKQFRIAEAVSVPVYGKSVSADPLYVLILQYVF